MQAGTGIEFWDWTDVTNATLIQSVALPNVNFSDYDVGAWWLAWQAPYVYVGASGNGIYIVDAGNIADPSKPTGPTIVKNVPISQTGGFRIHPVFPVGNLLVASSVDFGGTSDGYRHAGHQRPGQPDGDQNPERWHPDLLLVVFQRQ